MKILLDAGHGGRYPGAVCDGVEEKDVNLIMTKKVKGILESFGHNVFLTRNSDTHFKEELGADLSERCRIERKLSPHCFISFHCNSSDNKDASGFEVWTTPGETAADRLASLVIKSVEQSFPAMRMRKDMADGDPDRESRFAVLVGTNSPAILIELGFLSNTAERQWLSDEVNQNEMAVAICAGISGFRS